MPRLQATIPTGEAALERRTHGAGRRLPAAEVTVLPVRLELRHVVVDEQIGAVDGGSRHVEVEVDRQEQTVTAAEPVG